MMSRLAGFKIESTFRGVVCVNSKEIVFRGDHRNMFRGKHYTVQLIYGVPNA